MRQKYYSTILVFACFLSIVSSAFTFHPLANSQSDEEAVNLRITQVDTSHFPQVKVYVSAMDSNGDPIPVNPANLVLRENDQKVTTDLVSGEGDSGQLTTMLVIDISGSMNTGGKLSMAKKVASEYIKQMRSNDQAGIVAFNTKVNLVQSVTTDRNNLLSAIDNLKAGNDTAMYDALIKATDVLNPLSGRKAIIVLTDGLDNQSKNSPADVLNSIGKSGLTISTIGLGDPGQSTGNMTALDEKTLSALADKAGGSYGLATDQESLQQIYQKYGRALKSEYAITYTSQSKLRDGINRSLSVSLEEGGIASWSGATKTQFNPGGIVPEVASATSWPTFFGLLAILILLLFLPMIIRTVKRISPQKEAGPVIPVQKATRVKLK
jgi:Ca-activated chloride channel homolog